MILFASYNISFDISLDPFRSYPEVLQLLEKISFDADRISRLFRQYLPQLDYYRQNSKRVEDELDSARWILTDIFGQDVDEELQGENSGPLKRSTATSSDSSGLRQRRNSITLDQIAAYKVACEYLKRDESWRVDWGITPRNQNKNGKKLITLGGMYPIVSWIMIGFTNGLSGLISVHVSFKLGYDRILHSFCSAGLSLVATRD